MNKGEIIEEMRKQNPWWDGKEVSLPDKTVKRDILPHCMEELKKTRAKIIIGLRRTGKTTLLKMLIKKLKDKKHMCYFSFDLAKEISPRKVIKIYEEEILRKPLSKIRGSEERVYFFFDEIQKVENWGNEIKSVQDKNYNVKFFLTGSSSINITKGAGESLVGRVKINKLQPFSFREFLRYKGVENPRLSLDKIHYPKESSRMRILFKEYMEKGGLPELYERGDSGKLNDMLDLVFFRDIVEMFNVKRGDILRDIFKMMVRNSGQKVNYSKISGRLDSQYRTVKEYIEYLKDSFLIESSPSFEKNISKSARKEPKVYVADHAYFNLWKAEKGLKAETVAFNHLKRKEEVYYNRKPEVDMILNKKAFEIKYTDNPTKKDIKNLLKLPNNFKLFLVTKDRYDKWNVDGKEINLIPLWLVCLAFG